MNQRCLRISGIVMRCSGSTTSIRNLFKKIKGSIFTLPGHMSDDIKDLISGCSSSTRELKL